MRKNNTYTYIVYDIEDDRRKYITSEFEKSEYCPGYHAGVLRVSSADNLISELKEIRGLMHANIQPTKKVAEEIAKYWNDCYKRNGTYLFG